MNVSFNWLKDYLQFDLTPQETMAALTSIGLETEGLEEKETIKGGLKGLVVGKVLTCEPHPDSDHMHVTTVDLGNGQEPVQIVCGAPNVAAGQKVIVATLGTVLYDGDKSFTIKKSKLRGVESNGMLCAEDEIGVGTDHNGIIVLPEDTPLGLEAAKYYNVESDWVLEVDITPNRIDGASHWGVARDLYAYLVEHGRKAELKRPAVDAFRKDRDGNAVQIEVENTEACPRYSGLTIEGVTVKESPAWLKDRLSAIGLRPINNIVDITNFILFETGVPMHTFDLDKIHDRKVIVKTWPEGTPFVTLDGQEHKLTERDLTISDPVGPMCIAGVFGGLESGTTTETKNVFLEAACFNPTWIRKTARRQGLQTDASFRYERGVDINALPYALRRAALLVKELAGGEIVGDPVEIYPVKKQLAVVDLSYARVNALCGIEIPVADVKRILSLLEMNILEETAEGVKIEIPAYRVDVTRECDVIEDLLRIYGYDRVTWADSVHMNLSPKTETDESVLLQQLISEQLTGAGWSEIMNNSLTSEAFYEGLETYPQTKLVKLMNPLSADLNVVRQTLLFGGLQSIIRNINYKQTDLRFYEFGNTSFFDADKHAAQPDVPLAGHKEEAHLGLWLTGNKVSDSWAHANEKATVFELKAQVLNILRRLGIASNLKQRQYQNDIFAAGLEIASPAGKVLANLGIVSNKLLHKFDIEQEVYYADLDWKVLMKEAARVKVQQQEIAKFPPVKRDLALLVDKAVQFAEIERLVLGCDKKVIKKVTLFDVYEGKNLPEGKKSYAISITLLDAEKTLQDKQIVAIMDKVVKTLQNQVKAELR
jgi:phenylalanyl-tRNA synthetase beta chain